MKKIFKLIPVYIIMACLAIFYIVTLVDGLNPVVDKVYRAYYIDKTIDKVYSGINNHYGIEYKFGTPIINNGDAENQLKYLATGWSGLELGCVWETNQESVIIIYLNEINREKYQFKMNLAAPADENAISLYINDKKVTVYNIPADFCGEVVADIDSSFFEENEYNFVTLKAENVYKPSDKGGADNRQLVCLVADIVIE